MAESTSLGGILTGKYAGVPGWVWFALGTGGLALFLTKKKKSAPSTSSGNATDLGSASELANLFQVAGLMPYQGGDVYINQTFPATPPSTSPGGNVPTGPPAVKPPVIPKPKPPAKAQTILQRTQPVVYRVKRGDTLSGIAAKYGLSAKQLYQYNLTKGIRPESTIQTLKKRGPNLLFKGEEIDIPKKGTIYSGGHA